MILGITGGTGCGKTTLLEMIRQAGGVVLDCDAIYHELLRTDGALLAAIEDRFPGTVEGGTLQRKKLGAVVFADPEALADAIAGLMADPEGCARMGETARRICREQFDRPYSYMKIVRLVDDLLAEQK